MDRSIEAEEEKAKEMMNDESLHPHFSISMMIEFSISVFFLLRIEHYEK